MLRKFVSYAALLSLAVGCTEAMQVESTEGVSSIEATLSGSGQQTQKLIAPDGVAFDNFGSKVATDGATLVIGARFADSGGTDNGAAYVYARTGSRWTFVQRLTSTQNTAYSAESFGASVAVQGNIIVIGAHKADKNPIPDCGAFYIFQNTGGAWSQVQKVWAPDAAALDHFGWSVSFEAGSLLVGAPEDDDRGTDSGSVYVYSLTGTSAVYAGKLNGSESAAGDGFGKSLSRDGSTLVVGAAGHDLPVFGGGAAYVFSLSSSSWTQSAKLTSSDVAPGDQFGFGVSASGSRVLVSAITSDARGSDSGAAYIFVRAASGAWTQEQKLSAGDGAANDNFGRGLSLEGNVAIIGSVGKATYGAYSGAAYLFTLGAMGWTQDQQLFANDPTPDARFGYWVEGNGSGEFFITADQASGVTASAGAVYVHTVNAPIDCMFLADGAPCDDGDLCTTGEICRSGVCGSGNAVICPAPTECQITNMCDANTGQCVAVSAADGTPCDDGNVCTNSDTCQAGACASGPGGDTDADAYCDAIDNCPNTFNPSQLDLNGDGSGDACVTACLIYQRGTSGTVIDSAVQASLPTYNFGSAQSLNTGSLNGVLRRFVIQADISAIPRNSSIASATLSLTTGGVTGAGTIKAHRASAAWAETTVNWNNLVFASNVEASAAVSSLVVANFDLTALAQQWVNGTYPNQGVTIEEDLAGAATFRSSEYTVVSTRPKLTLCYLAPAQ